MSTTKDQAAEALDDCTSNGAPRPPYRAIWRIVGIAFASGEPFEAWVNEGEQVVAIEADHADRGYWIRTDDGAEVLVDGDPMSLLVPEAEWLAAIEAERTEAA